MALSTTAEGAFGTLLKMCSDANGTSPTTIAELRDINLTISARSEETTAHNSGTPWTTKIATLLNMGPVEFMVNWDPAAATHDDATGLLYVMKQRAERTFQLVETDDAGTTIEFNAIVTSIKMNRGVSAVRANSITLEGTGAPDLSA